MHLEQCLACTGHWIEISFILKLLPSLSRLGDWRSLLAVTSHCLHRLLSELAWLQWVQRRLYVSGPGGGAQDRMMLWVSAWTCTAWWPHSKPLTTAEWAATEEGGGSCLKPALLLPSLLLPPWLRCGHVRVDDSELFTRSSRWLTDTRASSPCSPDRSCRPATSGDSPPHLQPGEGDTCHWFPLFLSDCGFLLLLTSVLGDPVKPQKECRLFSL